MTFMCAKELRGVRERNFTNRIAGVTSILVGFVVTGIIFYIGSNKSGLNDFVAILFSAWLILLGLFDFSTVPSPESVESDE
jgi:hypothetical protein